MKATGSQFINTRFNKIKMAAVGKLVKGVSTQIPILIEASKPKLALFLRYAKVELVPPSPAELPEVVRGFKKLIVAAKERKFLETKAKDAWVNTLITCEVIGWFFIGEVIGKRKLIGYEV